MSDAIDSYEIEFQIDPAFAAAVNAAELQRVVAAVLCQAGMDVAALTLVLTDDATQRELNRTYRGIDAATDVLSFAAREGSEVGPTMAAMPPELAAELDLYLGDVIIAVPYAARQAAQYGSTLAAELRLLTVHGVLHLLGYDHATAAEEAAMWRAQNAVLAEWGDPDSAQRTYAD